MKGRKPTPTPLKVLTGNPGRRPLPNEPRPPTSSGRCPSWLSLEGKRIWRKVAPELKRLGLLTELDRQSLEAYCGTAAMLRQAHEALAREGLIYEVNGMLRKRPEVAIASECVQQLRLLAAEFGMTPSSRSRIDVEPPAGPGSDFDDFLRRRPR